MNFNTDPNVWAAAAASCTRTGVDKIYRIDSHGVIRSEKGEVVALFDSFEQAVATVRYNGWDVTLTDQGAKGALMVNAKHSGLEDLE